jgi:hypothetical protein
MLNRLIYTIGKMGIAGEWGRKPRFINPESPGTDDFPLVGKDGVALDQLVPRHIRVPLVGATGNGAALSIPNPEGGTIYLTRILLVITTGMGGSRTLNVGIAANGTSSSSTLFSGVAAANASLLDNLSTDGEVESSAWTSGQFLTGTVAGSSGTVANLAGFVLVEYIKPAA